MIILKKIFYKILVLRSSIYQEACLAEAKSGGGSTITAAFLVGIFDAPLVMAGLLLIDSLIFNDEFIRVFYSTNKTSLFSISFVFFVLAFEYFYYEVLKIGSDVIASVPDDKVRALGLGYGFFSMVGGGLLVYLLW